METTNEETKPAEAAPPTQNGQTVDREDGGAQYKLPDAQTLQEVGQLPVKDENGNEIPFKSLYEDQPGRQLIVFIRHFYCGVRTPPTPLSSAPP
jgi:hypothetical protein